MERLARSALEHGLFVSLDLAGGSACGFAAVSPFESVEARTDRIEIVGLLDDVDRKDHGRAGPDNDFQKPPIAIERLEALSFQEAI
ncbi:MAG: hypothetical protein GVX90_06715 [Alphaproteobacteria bacterium]|nr:hypothetical protein [Alphaproteobacteria bacterium]